MQAQLVGHHNVVGVSSCTGVEAIRDKNQIGKETKQQKTDYKFGVYPR